MFLRARYYSSAQGRFLTRDTWQGINNKPLSLNRWTFGFDNPVNYSDPSGRFPEFCKSMPTKAAYAKCVLQWYDLEPYDPDNLDFSIEGSEGCYIGPDVYRAPGYIEGLGVLGQSIFAGGVELVYDFATLQKSDFKYFGGGFHDTSVGFSISLYVGLVKGFKSYPYDIFGDYGGESGSFTLGLSGGPFSTGGGGGIFTSHTDPLIRGGILYAGEGLTKEILPIVDFSSLVTTYTKHSNYIESYGDPALGLVNLGELLIDIQTGEGSPWLFVPVPFARGFAQSMAIKYAVAYQDLHSQGTPGK